jgi:hypothetical protein
MGEVPKNLKCSTGYAYFNNDANAFAVKNAEKLRYREPQGIPGET